MEWLLDKFDMDISLIAGYMQLLFPIVRIFRHITLSFFDFRMNGEIVIASDDRAGNIPIFNGERHGFSDIQAVKSNISSV